MYKIYFAGDLFDQKHLTGNLILARYIEKLSHNKYTCVLPQDWEGEHFNNSVSLRNKDIASVIQADFVIFNFDGTDLDSGTVVEFIITKMLDIPAILLRTDFRCNGHLFDDDWNLMVAGYPRCTIVKHHSLQLYNKLGLDKMHQIIAHSIIEAFETVAREKPILDSYDKIIAAHQHVVAMCGGRLEQTIPLQQLHEIVSTKMKKGIYSEHNSMTNFLSTSRGAHAHKQ